MSSAFKDEKELTRWLVRSPLIEHSPESAEVYKTPDLVNFNPIRKKFSEDYRAKFHEEPPKSAEIDLIYIPTIDRSLKMFFPHAVEIKYIRYGKGRKINWPYYAGLAQILAYLKFGFQRTHLWHFFDHEIQKEEACKYIKNLADLLKKTQLPLPISYAYYLIELEDENREFNTRNLYFPYEGRDASWVNPYYNTEKTDFIRKFILNKMGASFRE